MQHSRASSLPPPLPDGRGFEHVWNSDGGAGAMKIFKKREQSQREPYIPRHRESDPLWHHNLSTSSAFQGTSLGVSFLEGTTFGVV